MKLTIGREISEKLYIEQGSVWMVLIDRGKIHNECAPN